MKGRKVYRALAQAAVANAQALMRDSRALQRRGSRGHAVSLNVLAIEEGSKALVYKLAAEGVFRIVRKHPNNISTYRERDLLDHPFKHAIATRFLVAAVSFAPFQQALDSSRKKVFTRAEVATTLRLAHSLQALHVAELRRGGRMTREIERYSQAFGRLNFIRNSGFYVGHPDGTVALPNEVASTDYRVVGQLAELVVGAMREFIRTPFTTAQRREFSEQTQAAAEYVRTHRPNQGGGETEGGEGPSVPPTQANSTRGAKGIKDN